MLVRMTRPEEYETTERLTWRAFTDRSRLPGDVTDEHYMLHRLRAAADWMPELDLICREGNVLVGHAACTRAWIERGDGSRDPVVAVGPVSVLPEKQGKGVGSALMLGLTERAEALGEKAMILFGHEGFYPRFGFVPASPLGLTVKGEAQGGYFMALLLDRGFSLEGAYVDSDSLKTDEQGLRAYQMDFEKRA